MKKNILYIVSSLKKSGPNIQLLNLVQHLNVDKYRVNILTLSKDPSESLLETFRELNVNVIEKPMSKFFISFYSIKKIILDINPDIIHSSGIRPDGISSKNFFGIPTVSTVHNFMFDDYIFRYGKILGNIMVNKHLRYLKKIKAPFVCSISIKELYEEKKHTFLAIQNGVDISKYEEVSTSKKEYLRNELKLPQDKKILISTGHLSKLKNPQLIIEAFLKQKKSHENLLVFLGDGELKNELEEKYRESTNILFKGQVNNVSAYLQASDIFVSASYTEGLPNAVLEAMATNLHLLLSNIKPHQEIYNFPLVSYKSFSPSNLTEAIKSMDLIIERVNNSTPPLNRNVLMENFSSEKMSNKYQMIYDKL